MFDTVIIGAGVVGAMVARKLSEYDLKVCILEKENDVSMGATKANSAIVHAGFDAKEGSLKAELNVKGSQMMPKVCEELGVKYKNNGSLVIGFNEEDEKTIKELYIRGCENGVKDLKVIYKDEIRKLEENIGDDVTCALYAPTGAIVCPYELTVAAIGNAMDNGAELLRNFKVTKISESDGIYTLRAEDEREVLAKYVINCAGLNSDEIAKMAGDTSISIHPRRGEYMLLDNECKDLISHTIFRTPSKMGKGILVSPTVDNNLLLGPTSVDMEDKDDKKTTKEGFDKIIKEAKENVKNIQFGKVITSFCGLRAVGNTGDFIIKSHKKGFINAAGIESPGLSASPAIAEYILNMLEGMGFNYSKKENFNPTRKPMHAFREMSIEEKNEVIKTDPSFGKIICRCETVSEGEILEAIRQNPKAVDLDGVKRRTRAQMGRCQGGFCSPYIVELLAREMNINYEEVTKFGGASRVNISRTKEEI